MPLFREPRMSQAQIPAPLRQGSLCSPSASNAVVVLFFPYAFNQIGKAVTFGFLAAMAIAQAAVTWLWVPETKNKTLEEIERAWMGEGAVGTPAPAE